MPANITVSEIKRHKKAAVFGASGAIGHAMCQQLVEQGCQKIFRLTRSLDKLNQLEVSNSTAVEINDIYFDLTDEGSIVNAIAKIDTDIDLVFIATGWLHDIDASHPKPTAQGGYAPEKTFKNIQADHLFKSWQINFLGPSLILKEVLLRLPHRQKAITLAVLSARVGSISDNRLGGWYSYRTSKAALNMMVKNLAIELQRMRSKAKIVALQPGTTDSQLSKPFQNFLAEGQLQSANFSAQHLLQVINALSTENSGTLMDFAGNTISP